MADNVADAPCSTLKGSSLLPLKISSDTFSLVPTKKAMQTGGVLMCNHDREIFITGYLRNGAAHPPYLLEYIATAQTILTVRIESYKGALYTIQLCYLTIIHNPNPMH